MCLAHPARVIERLDEDSALVDLGGMRKAVSVALVPEVQCGQYIIVHVGYAIGLLDEDEAQATLALFAALGESEPKLENNLPESA